MKKLGPITVIDSVDHWVFGVAIGNDPVHGVYFQIAFWKWVVNLSLSLDTLSWVFPIAVGITLGILSHLDIIWSPW